MITNSDQLYFKAESVLVRGKWENLAIGKVEAQDWVFVKGGIH